MTAKPKFHIVENYDDAPDYEVFKEDYLDPLTSMKGLIEKYGMSKGTYNRLARQVREETGLHRKPIGYSRNTLSPQYAFNENLYIHKRKSGYAVIHTIDYCTRSYGVYQDIETARMVRNTLVECNWDDKVALELKSKYCRPVRRPAYEKAVRLYPRFKELYASGKYKMYEILEMMNITQKVYSYMVQMFREEVKGNDYS